MTGSKNATLAILFSVVIVDLIGFGIVVPILPFYARAYEASAALARVFGPFAAGLLYDLADRAPFLLAAALVGIACALSVRLPEPAE